MSNYYAPSGELQYALPRVPRLTFTSSLALVGIIRRHLAHRRTIRALQRLDTRILEDLGIPHQSTSPSAGALERFSDIIRPRNGI